MEDNAFQTLTWLNLKGPKLLQTDNECCPAAKHRRAQKHKLLPRQHQWHPKPPCFPHLLHSLHFHPARVSHLTSGCYLRPLQPQAHGAQACPAACSEHSSAGRTRAAPRSHTMLPWEPTHHQIFIHHFQLGGPSVLELHHMDFDLLHR